MSARRSIQIAISLSMMAGCAPRSQDPAAAPSRPLGKEFPTYRAPQPNASGALSRVDVQEPAGPITLSQALALALMNNPVLAGASWDIRAAEARRLQAGLPPNPELELEAENFGGTGQLTGSRSLESTISLGQLIELGGKRAKRTRLAALEQDLSRWDFEARRIDVYGETTRAFVDLLASQQRLALAEELTRISQQVLETAAERVSSGKAAPVERHKAQVALGASRLQLERTRREVHALRQRLAAIWGVSQPRFTRAEGDIEAVAAIPSEEQLASLIAQNPDVARWKTEMEQRQAALALERAKAVADLTLRGGIRRLEEPDDTGFVAGVSIPLPIFDRNQGGIREAMAKLAKAGEQRRAAEMQAHTSLAAAYQVMASALAEATILKNDILPAARQAFDAANEGYRQGKFPYLDVLDAQRTLYEARGQHLEALAEYHKAVADVERLTGESLSRIAASAPATHPARLRISGPAHSLSNQDSDRSRNEGE